MEPQASPALSNSRLTFCGSMCDGSSNPISTVSKPQLLNLGNSRVLCVVKGDVNRKVLIPNLIVPRTLRPLPRDINGKFPPPGLQGAFTFFGFPS